MKILLLGGGGREHALAWKIAQSDKVEKLYIAPGNAGTANVGENVDIKADDFGSLKDFAVEKGINMVVVGPEDPLVKGIYDEFKNDARTANIPELFLKAQKILPKDSCSATTYRQQDTRHSTAQTLRKD